MSSNRSRTFSGYGAAIPRAVTSMATAPADMLATISATASDAIVAPTHAAPTHAPPTHAARNVVQDAAPHAAHQTTHAVLPPISYAPSSTVPRSVSRSVSLGIPHGIATALVPRATAGAQSRVGKGAPESVATLLSPTERARVDAAGEGCFITLHRESVDEVLTDLRLRRASAVLVSVSHYVTQQTPPVARLVREFPRVPAVALLTGMESASSQAVLSLGQQGVRALVDVRDARGWRELRRLIAEERAESVERMAITRLQTELAGAPEDCHRFFEALFSSPASVCTVRQLSRRLGVLPSTLMSRFFRAQLPAPKKYLAMARLVRAARLFESPGLSVAQVAMQLEYSSPQSFSRHVQILLQCTAVSFRRQYTGQSMLELMCAELIAPYRDVLCVFNPLIVTPAWMGREH